MPELHLILAPAPKRSAHVDYRARTVESVQSGPCVKLPELVPTKSSLKKGKRPGIKTADPASDLITMKS